MSDLISRQAAIDAIKASTSKYTGFMEMEMYTVDDAITAVNTVPSAESVRHGKWLWLDGVRCSECNYKIPTIGLPNYCPQCGAYMRESK